MIRKASADASSPFKSSGKPLGNEAGWTDEKTKELLNEMKQLIAKPDVSKYQTSLERFDWKRVKIGQFSGDECKNQFLIICKKLRKYKTLSDLVAESLEYLENSYKGNIKTHPDHPKRPLTAYFRFFLSEREKCAAKHKDLTNLEIMSILSEKYKTIGIEDKERLTNEWKAEMVVYRRLLEQFKKDHPDYYYGSPPGLSRTPVQISNCAPDTLTTPIKTKMSKKEQDILKKNYHDLSDQEKLPYILKAIEEWGKYKEELEMYRKCHPDFIPTAAQNKCTLTLTDWRIYDKDLGKPDRPPASGYSLFCTRMMLSDAMKHTLSRDRLIECGQKWKLLTDAEKQAYQVEILSLKTNYATEMESFMKSLTPQQRQVYLEREKDTESKKNTKRRALIQVKEEVKLNGGSSSVEEEKEIKIDEETSSESSSIESSEEEEEEEEESTKKNKSPKKVATISSPSHRSATSISALFLYQKAHKEKCAAKHPNASKSDITIMLARRFNNLPKEKTAKWFQREKEQRALHDNMMRKKLIEEEKAKKSPELKPVNQEQIVQEKNKRMLGEEKAKNSPPELEPVTGEQMFQEEKKEMYMQKANGSFKKGQELMRRAWSSMNKERKKRYVTAANERNARNGAEHPPAKAATKEISTSLTPQQKQENSQGERGTESKKSSKRRASIQLKEEEENVEPTKKSKSPKKVATISSPSHRPATSISALFLYQNAHKEKFAAKYPNASESIITVKLARRFNNLSKEKKAKWFQQEKEQRALHDDMMRKKLLEEEKAKNAPPKPKPVTGEELFQEEKKEMYMQKANGSLEKGQELMRRGWISMNKERKKKFISAADEQNARNGVEHPPAKPATKEISTESHVERLPKEIQSYLALEPKKVPQNALALFKVEQEPRLIHLECSARNQELARLWSSMTANAKDEYRRRAKAGKNEYNKKLERWKKLLPPQAHEAYMAQLKNMARTKSKASNEKESVTNGTSQKRKSGSTETASSPKKTKLSKEVSGDSSEESSGDEDSSSSSDGSDSEEEKTLKKPATKKEKSSGDSSSSSDSSDSEEEKTSKKPATTKKPATKKEESSGDSSSCSDSSDSEEEKTPKKPATKKKESSGNSSSSSNDDSD